MVLIEKDVIFFLTSERKMYKINKKGGFYD